MADRLYTSSQADDIISSLRMETNLEKYIIARIAFIFSLMQEGNQVKDSFDFRGGEMKKTTFFGTDEVFIKTLISFVYKTIEFDENKIYSNKSIIKNHIDSGAFLIWKIFEKNGQDINKWYNELYKMVELINAREFFGKELDVFIGRDVVNNEGIILELNNTSIHPNSQLAIMGKPGVGKTQFLLKMLSDIRTQSNYQTNFIYFDYKGDVACNKKFEQIVQAKTYRLLKGSEYLPINPFMLENYNQKHINLSAREKAESFASINSQLGVVQKGNLERAIISAYTKREKSEKPFPDFQDVLEIASQMYQEENKKDDTLIEVLRDLANFNLFWAHCNESNPFEKISNRTMIIDLHEMPVLKELVCYLVIERLYKEMAILPDSEIKDNRRSIRTILVIDEAHNYLAQKNIFLQRIIREGRSKGIVVFFASQSPSDYQQKFFNFQELLEFVFIFQCDGVSSSAIQDTIGCSKKTANDLQTEIARLEPFQAIMKGTDKNRDFLKFTAEAFYKKY